MTWTHQPHRLAKPAPAAIEKHERRAGRDTAYKKASAAARRRDGGRCRIGNAVVPQITEWIGRRLMEADAL